MPRYLLVKAIKWQVNPSADDTWSSETEGLGSGISKGSYVICDVLRDENWTGRRGPLRESYDARIEKNYFLIVKSRGHCTSGDVGMGGNGGSNVIGGEIQLVVRGGVCGGEDEGDDDLSTIDEGSNSNSPFSVICSLSAGMTESESSKLSTFWSFTMATAPSGDTRISLPRSPWSSCVDRSITISSESDESAIVFAIRSTS
ncbi:hypothetical protein ACHAXS_012452 [Conticribra weissflogii]